MNRHQRRAFVKRKRRMATISLDITFKYTREEKDKETGKPAKVTEERLRAFTIDSDDIPLILVEGMEEGKFGLMREGIADFLGLTQEESRQLTVRHMKAIGKAMKDAQTIPNG